MINSEVIFLNKSVELNYIGYVFSPFETLENMPIQPTGELASHGYIKINDDLVAGLKDLEEFSHLMVIYHLHEVKNTKLEVIPFLDDKPHGIFATRSPVRPNPIGFSIIEIEKVEGSKIYANNLDMLNKTPVLDIKPYVPDFDLPKKDVKAGWFENAAGKVKTKKSDDRFL